MSKDYLPHKAIRKKIEGITTETDTKYKTKSQLIAYGKVDNSKLASYQNKDFVVDDDIVIGYMTKEAKMTVQVDGYTVNDIDYIRCLVTPESGAGNAFNMDLTYTGGVINENITKEVSMNVNLDGYTVNEISKILISVQPELENAFDMELTPPQ